MPDLNQFKSKVLGETLSVRELDLMVEINTHISQSLDYKEVLQFISDGVSDLLNTDTASIYSLRGEDEMFLEVATPALDPEFAKSFRQASLLDHAHVNLTLQSRKPQQIADVAQESLTPAEQHVLEMTNTKSVLYFPLIIEENIFGILILGVLSQPRAFSEREIYLGKMLADQLTGAIQKTILHQNLKHHKENLEMLVKKRTQALEEANVALREINSELKEKNELVCLQKEELEAALDQLKVAQTRMVQTEKMVSLGVLTAGVAHEIKNPLNFIQGSYNGLINFFKETGIKDANAIKMLDYIKLGIEKSSAIVSVLNDFSRNRPAKDQDCDVRKILENCLLMVNNQLYKGHIELEKNIGAGELIVSGQPNKLHQLFINVMLNATQAMEPGGKLSISTHQVGGDLYVLIEDTGSGIKKELLQQIVEPFFTTKDPGKGTGLGLSIAYSIVEDHEGSMEFESEPGKGTTVKIRLPLRVY